MRSRTRRSLFEKYSNALFYVSFLKKKPKGIFGILIVNVFIVCISVHKSSLKKICTLLSQLRNIVVSGLFQHQICDPVCLINTVKEEYNSPFLKNLGFCNIPQKSISTIAFASNFFFDNRYLMFMSILHNFEFVYFSLSVSGSC